MDEGDREGFDADRLPPWEELRRWYRRLRRRLSLRPPELTEADMVPPGAWPICPFCVIAHHPLAVRCPHCGEIVAGHATIMPYVWILVWGPRLQRVVRQERLSRVLWAGLVVSAVAYLANPAGVLVGILWTTRPDHATWGEWALNLTAWAVLSFIHVGAGARMLLAANRTWGTWRSETADGAD